MNALWTCLPASLVLGAERFSGTERTAKRDPSACTRIMASGGNGVIDFIPETFGPKYISRTSRYSQRLYVVGFHFVSEFRRG